MPRLIDPAPPRWGPSEITIDVDAPVERALDLLITPLLSGRYRLRTRTPSSVVLRMRGAAWWLLNDFTPVFGWLERRFGWRVGLLGHTDAHLLLTHAVEGRLVRLRVRGSVVEHDARLLMAADLHDRQGVGVAVKRFGEVCFGAGYDDETVHMARQ